MFLNRAAKLRFFFDLCKKKTKIFAYLRKKLYLCTVILSELNILNYRNIRDASLSFSDKLNCFVGLNGQGKTNLLDAIYLLSFTKSALSPTDSQNITHGEELSFVRGTYKTTAALNDRCVGRSCDSDTPPTLNDRCAEGTETITCGLKKGVKKQFRRGDKDYKRLLDHIGLIPLVMVCPEDGELIAEGSDERRRFLDVVIAQYNKPYLETLTRYNALLKQRNALLKSLEETPTPLPPYTSTPNVDLLATFEVQMVPLAEQIFQERTAFVERFIPLFQEIYNELSDGQEQVSLRYVSQLQDRNLAEAYERTRQRDVILGWTSQGVHKDELEMLLDGYPLKRVGSQGQQKTYLLAMKLAQAVSLGKPILLLDDIFDKLDAERVERIIRLVDSDRFGQIFITDTDRQHLTQLIPHIEDTACIFHV